MTCTSLLLLRAYTLFAQLPAMPGRVALRAFGDRNRDRGDIPGWVMIAMMSAAVVVVLIPLVGPKIGDAFSNAVDSVSNTNSNTGK